MNLRILFVCFLLARLRLRRRSPHRWVADPKTRLKSLAFGSATQLLCLFGAPGVLAQGPGDLTVVPTRVVLEGRDRSAQLSLINRAARAATYRISFTRMRMTEDGRFEEIDEPAPGEQFADPLIRYSPRQVTLEPGVAQTIRFMLRKPADLAAGEYRSHLVLRAVPDDISNSVEAEAVGDRNLTVRLTPVYRIAVPVIVRHGELRASAELSQLRFEPGGEGAGPAVSFRLDRWGNRSLYGDVAVTFIPDHGGAETVVGRIVGLAVYTPNPARSLTLPLSPPPGIELRAGRLKVGFSEEPGLGGAETAEGELPLS